MPRVACGGTYSSALVHRSFLVQTRSSIHKGRRPAGFLAKAAPEAVSLLVPVVLAQVVEAIEVLQDFFLRGVSWQPRHTHRVVSGGHALTCVVSFFLAQESEPHSQTSQQVAPTSHRDDELGEVADECEEEHRVQHVEEGDH